MPTIPVVTAKVGSDPKPEPKDTSQNAVLLIEAGLYIAHDSANLFGPIPKTGCLASVCLVTDMVAEAEGPTSTFDKPKRFGK